MWVMSLNIRKCAYNIFSNKYDQVHTLYMFSVWMTNRKRRKGMCSRNVDDEEANNALGKYIIWKSKPVKMERPETHQVSPIGGIFPTIPPGFIVHKSHIVRITRTLFPSERQVHCFSVTSGYNAQRDQRSHRHISISVEGGDVSFSLTTKNVPHLKKREKKRLFTKC